MRDESRRKLAAVSAASTIVPPQRCFRNMLIGACPPNANALSEIARWRGAGGR
jgi:hypothetical protein